MPVNEPIPVTDFTALLDAQWNASNVAKPQLLEVNIDSTPIRVDLRNNGDAVTVRADNPAEKSEYLGNWTYVTKTYQLLLEIWSVDTTEERQRLYDIMREIRRVCNNRRHNMTSFQRIEFESFNELANEQDVMWAGQCRINLVNSAVLSDTT